MVSAPNRLTAASSEVIARRPAWAAELALRKGRVDLVVQQSRLRDGSRKVTYISEVVGMEGDTIVMTDIFKFDQTGIDTEGKIIGELEPTGMRPLFSPRLEDAGFKLGANIYTKIPSQTVPPERRRARR